MIRLGTWASVVAGAVMVVSLSAAAQEQAAGPAAEQTVDSTVQPSADPAAPPAVESPAPPAAEPPAPAAAEPPAPAAVASSEAPAEEAAAPPVEEAAVEEEAPPVEEAPGFAKFVDINDAVPGRFFDAAATVPDGNDPNRLVIGFHSGIDWNTWKNTEFRASTESFNYTSAMDTISFRIEAPKGYYISRITYSQRGRGSALRLGRAAGGAQWVVASVAAPLGQFGTNPAVLEAEADLTGLRMTSVPVSITNGLFVSAPPAAGAGLLEVNSAEVQVYLAAIIGQ